MSLVRFLLWNFFECCWNIFSSVVDAWRKFDIDEQISIRWRHVDTMMFFFFSEPKFRHLVLGKFSTQSTPNIMTSYWTGNKTFDQRNFNSSTNHSSPQIRCEQFCWALKFSLWLVSVLDTNKRIFQKSTNLHLQREFSEFTFLSVILLGTGSSEVWQYFFVSSPALPRWLLYQTDLKNKTLKNKICLSVRNILALFPLFKLFTCESMKKSIPPIL